jgi:hypothetical protein
MVKKIRLGAVLTCLTLTVGISAASFADSDESSQTQTVVDFKIDSARWDADKSRLEVRGTGQNGQAVAVTNAVTSALVGTTDVSRSSWRLRERSLTSVPCSVLATQSDGQTAILDIRNAPTDCDAGTIVSSSDTVGGTTPTPPVIPNSARTTTAGSGQLPDLCHQ